VDAPPPEPNVEEEAVLNFDFRRYLDALRQYVWVVIALMALAVTAAVIYTGRQTRIYQASASVQIEPRLPDMIGEGGQTFTRANVGGTDYYAQQQTLLGSHRLIEKTVANNRLYMRLFTEEQRRDRKVDDLIQWGTGVVQGMISVSYPAQDRTMYVTVRGADRQLAADIANAHIQTYVEHSRGMLSTDTKQASGALSTEFDEAETKLREAEAALYQYQQDNDLLAVTLEERQSMVSTGITAYTAKLNEAHADRLELSAKLDRMRKAATEDVLKSPILLLGNNASFDSLRAKYYEERNKFIELEKEVGPKNPQYVMAKAKIDDLYSALQSEATRMMKGLEEQVQAALATEGALNAEVEKRTKEALELGPKVVAYNELLRRKKSMEDRYNILRTRLSTTDLTDRMSRNIDSSNVRPLDRALVPGVAVYPKLRTNILAAAVLSLFLGLGLVGLIVFLDRSIKSTSDAQQAAGSPVLGVIPVLEEMAQGDDDLARDLYVHEHPTSRIAECCRSLRTNIMFSAADREIKTLVVSSANPREGKTTSVIYLGTTMAQSGQRVLLVDTDMRRPRLHVSLGVSRQTGLSNLIVGDQDYEDVIHATKIPNLSILPCGPLPPNPAEILMSHRFETVLAELSKRFDRVIFDSPPLNVVTDAVILSKQTDGVILVAHADKTLRDELKRSSRQIKTVNGKIFGVIVNAIEADQRSGYYYSYYGYKYSEESGEPSRSS
jgi:polysaccharide biosynthesis transport protein